MEGVMIINDPATFWAAVSGIGSLLAVLTALCLSMLPALRKMVVTKRSASQEVKRVFELVNHYLEQYKFVETSLMTLRGRRYRAFRPNSLGLELQLNPCRMLEGIQREVHVLKNPKLSQIYQKSLELFSGWFVQLSAWFELEAEICLFFSFDTKLKKFFPTEYETFAGAEDKAGFERVYHCIGCIKDYPYEEGFIQLGTDSVSKVFQVPICKEHKIPMQISFRERKPQEGAAQAKS
jgi:hypothetical protein